MVTVNEVFAPTATSWEDVVPAAPPEPPAWVVADDAEPPPPPPPPLPTQVIRSCDVPRGIEYLPEELMTETTGPGLLPRRDFHVAVLAEAATKTWFGNGVPRTCSPPAVVAGSMIWTVPAPEMTGVGFTVPLMTSLVRLTTSVEPLTSFM
jgi:hypothetical protein